MEELKKAIACHLFLDNLQSYLNIINDEIVKCGCPKCTDDIGGNYPHDEENIDRKTQSLKPGKGQINHIEKTKDCLLYKWFKEKCKEFNAPVPIDDVDNPKWYPRSFNLMTCLGRGNKGWNTEENLKKRWRFRVKQLKYEEQVKTVYRMLYEIDNLGCPYGDDEKFESWFRVKGVSLI